MKLGMMFASSFAIAGMAVSLVGCSSESGSGSDEKTGPVATSPLKGSIEGKEFVAAYARAIKGFDEGEVSIDIFDAEVGCQRSANEPDRKILFFVPWAVGTREFKLGGGDDAQTATFVIQRDGQSDNIIATVGRVEIVDAPTGPGERGKIRLRAVAGDSNVEGEIEVEVCGE
jgi:hypothetical protein